MKDSFMFTKCCSNVRRYLFSANNTCEKEKSPKVSHYPFLHPVGAWLERCSYTARGAHTNRSCRPICWRLSVSETFLWLRWHGENESGQLLGCRRTVAKGDEAVGGVGVGAVQLNPDLRQSLAFLALHVSGSRINRMLLDVRHTLICCPFPEYHCEMPLHA